MDVKAIRKGEHYSKAVSGGSGGFWSGAVAESSGVLIDGTIHAPEMFLPAMHALGYRMKKDKSGPTRERSPGKK